ncbi:hypothetical protein H7X87_02430 [Acetobacteraceae bacterium]|nr:hypothetical protein [Candidatus Parcubacteria bacterium]
MNIRENQRLALNRANKVPGRQKRRKMIGGAVLISLVAAVGLLLYLFPHMFVGGILQLIEFAQWIPFN